MIDDIYIRGFIYVNEPEPDQQQEQVHQPLEIAISVERFMTVLCLILLCFWTWCLNNLCYEVRI